MRRGAALQCMQCHATSPPHGRARLVPFFFLAKEPNLPIGVVAGAGSPRFRRACPDRQSLDGFTAGWAQRGSCRAHVYRNQGDGSQLVTAMKATWNDLLARFPDPYVLVAVLPDSSEMESIFNAHSAQRLMVRLIRNLPTHGEFAVMVSRQSGQREILCAFGDGSDAALVAKAACASMSDRARYSFVLDESAERNLLKIAGPPEPHRPRATSYNRWQS